ncbi:tyrosine-type recombinase/integrase [Salipaludibacillus sp. CF4.18]|uniref:tyrosine-type recombinase/integrase n=1 Tax=Salipaludibacillus sp. CF4.18 TaxID=3373081 RepID=UPI003EE49EC7
MASFEKHADKNWEYRIKYKNPLTGKFREKSKRGFATKTEARRAAEDMERSIDDGNETNKDITLDFYLKDWLQTWKLPPKVRKNTYDLHKNNINNHIIPYYKKLKLVELTPKKHQNFLDSLSANNYSKRTIEIVHGTMYSAMDRATIENKIQRNPCVGIIITAQKESKNKEKLEYIDSENIPLFLRHAYEYNPLLWLFFKFLLDSGSRKGEAAALQWSDINLEEGLININKTLDFSAKANDKLFGDTKTFKSKRVITIRKSLIKDLSLHKTFQEQNKLALTDIYKHDLDLVFCRKDGNFLPKSTLFNALERILKRANLPQIPIHALRDSHAVLLLEAGASLEYVQRRLGHRDYSTTANIYSHVSKKIERDTLEKYEDHMDDILK